MACDAYRNRLLAYLDGDLSGEAQAAFEAHLTGCPGCRGELRDLRATVALVAGMPVPEPPETFWRQYRRDLRRKAACVGEPSRLWSWLLVPLRRPVPAVAVGIALTIAVFLTWSRFPGRPPTAELASLNVTQQLVLTQDLDLLRHMELLEAMDLLEDWELIRSLDAHGLRKAA